MESELTELLAAALVKQLATDDWQQAEAAMVALWRRVHPEQGDDIATVLRRTRTAALEVQHSTDPQAANCLVYGWKGDLLRLVAADPDVVPELERLLAEWRSNTASGARADTRAKRSGRIATAEGR